MIFKHSTEDAFFIFGHKRKWSSTFGRKRKKRKWPSSPFSAPKTKMNFGRLLVWWLGLSDHDPSDFTTHLRHCQERPKSAGCYKLRNSVFPWGSARPPLWRGRAYRLQSYTVCCPCWPASTTNQSSLVTLTFDLLTLKVVSESDVTWATMPILVFLGLSVLPLRLMYATDRY